jgi:3-phosphoshikimate 1-carboxyvinyltransferase
MTDLVVHPLEKPLVGGVPVPPDRTIGHHALLLACLCEGVSELRGFAEGEDSLATAKAMRSMGALVEEPAKGVLRITGTGLMGLQAARIPLECGRSGTTMRMLTGILSGQSFASKLVGDAALSREPMMNVVGPLRARGASIDGTPHPTIDGELLAPLFVGPLAPDKELGPLEHTSTTASPDIKSALLLSGLYAHGTTWFKEPAVSRDHTERMLHALGVPIRTLATMIELEPAGWDGKLAGFDLQVPGDFSAAAFLLVAAQLHPGSRVTVRGVGINPTRIGLLEIARHMGAGFDVVPQGEQAGEPVGEVTAWHQSLRGTSIGGELVPRTIDELPIACALAARAAGATTIRDVDELDLLAATAGMLRAFGVTCEQLPNGLVVHGTDAPLDAARIESRGEPRLAMTAAVLALGARGPSTIVDCDAIGALFPRFVGTLRALGARIDVA